MAKRPIFGGWKPPKLASPFKAPGKPRYPNASAKQVKAPAMRRPDFEDLLCGAIRERMLVTLRYKFEPAPRLFQPEGVYYSTKEKVCVAGVQIVNPNDTSKNNTAHVFEVGEISNLRLTKDPFIHPVRFDQSDPKYKNGIICSA